MKTKQEIKQVFNDWAQCHGHRVVKSVNVLSLVGDVALRCRSGKFTIERATTPDGPRSAVIVAGFTHGYAYPVMNATEAKLTEFLETDTKSTLEYQEYVAAKMAGELDR